MPKSPLARELERRMREAGLTQKALALNAGLNETAVRDILTGKSRHPRHDTVQKLAAVLASVGRATIAVHRRPRVAIVSTGAELVEIDEVPGPGQVVNSNAYLLAAAVAEAGGEVLVLPIARDRRDDIRARLGEAAGADVVLSTGGVSVGEFDFVKEALDDLGVERLFWRVAQKPGKPLTVGRRGDTLFVGLPGNPVSALVCFQVYVRPALRRMGGHRRPLLEPHREFLLAMLRERPETTLHEMRERLAAERGVRVSHDTVWRFLKAERQSFKKKPAGQRDGSSGRGAPAGALGAAPGPGGPAAACLR